MPRVTPHGKTRPTFPALYDELIEAAHQARLVVMVGPQISAAAGVPDGPEIRHHLFEVAHRHVKTRREREVLKAAELESDPLLKDVLLRELLGDAFQSSVATLIHRLNPIPAKIHAALASLPGAVFLTSNVDLLLEQALTARGSSAGKIYRLSDADSPASLEQGDVLKLCGDIEHLESLVPGVETYGLSPMGVSRSWRQRLTNLFRSPAELLLVGFSSIAAYHAMAWLRATVADLPMPWWLHPKEPLDALIARAGGLRLIRVGSPARVVPWLKTLAILSQAPRDTLPDSVWAKSLSIEIEAPTHLSANTANEESPPVPMTSSLPPFQAPFQALFQARSLFQAPHHAHSLSPALPRERPDDIAEWSGYHEGRLPFERFRKVTGITGIDLVEQAFHTGGPTLLPPFDFGMGKPLVLRGREVLLGELEFALLCRLELLPALKSTLTRRGTLLLFEDVEARMRGRLVSLSGRQRPEEGPVSTSSAGITPHDKLLNALDTGLDEGWIGVIPRPTVPFLPFDDHDGTAALRERCLEVLAWHEALVDKPRRFLLTADYVVGADAMGYVSDEAWDPRHLEALEKRYDAVESQLVFLPRLVARVGPFIRGRIPDKRRSSDKATGPESGRPPDKADVPEQTRVQHQLAWLGFPDALQPATLVRLARAGFTLELGPSATPVSAAGEAEVRALAEGLDHPQVIELLDRMEWMARTAVHRAAITARAQISVLYSRAIWVAWTGRDWKQSGESGAIEPPEGDQTGFTTALLDRVTRLDQGFGIPLAENAPSLPFIGVLDHLFYWLAFAASHENGAFCVPGGDGELEFTPHSRGGRLWEFLDRWAGSDGVRYAAFARAVRGILCSLDQEADPDDPDPDQLEPFLIAVQIFRRSPFQMQTPEIQCLAILSANWTERPLSDYEVPFASGAQSSLESVNSERLLEYAAQLLSTEPTRLKRLGSFMSFEYPLPDGTFRTVRVPMEAVLLRAPDEVFSREAQVLAKWQGPQDGRAYYLLHQLALDPGNKTLRRDYARLTVLAPWRLIREDATFLRSWGSLLDWDHAFPSTIETLREMLSEPGPVTTQSLPSQLAARLREGGAWSARADVGALFSRSLQFPGRGMLEGKLEVIRLGWRQRNLDRGIDVTGSLMRLDEGRVGEQPSARLAGDIAILRLASMEAPIVQDQEARIDLREILPNRLVMALIDAMEPGRQGDTLAQSDTFAQVGSLAQAEPALLRLCQSVMDALALMSEGTVSVRDMIWLTWRLYQWLVAQIEALSAPRRLAALSGLQACDPLPHKRGADTPDLLDPRHFAPDCLDLRLMLVLQALGPLELSRQSDGSTTQVRSVSSPRLEALLRELASRPFTPMEQVLRRSKRPPSRLDWKGPATVPDLALQALLSLNSRAFAKLEPAVRLGWLRQLPGVDEDGAGAPEELVLQILSAATDEISQLDPVERQRLKEGLNNLPVREPFQVKRLMTLIALYGAGQMDLEQEVAASLNRFVSHPEMPELVGRYLAALSHVALERLESEVERLLRQASEHGGDPVPVALGLGRVIYEGSAAGVTLARALLRRLDSEPPYQNDKRMLRQLVLLGLR